MILGRDIGLRRLRALCAPACCGAIDMASDPAIGFADLDKLPIPSRYCILVLRSDGQVIRILPIRAQDDDDAERTAQMVVDGHAVDLWDGLRFIDHYPSLEITA